MTTAEQVTGVVEARNERGIRVGGEWHNLSKFRPLELPAVGTEVTLGLDPKGFLSSIEVLGKAGLMPPVNGATSSRDGTITRLAVLKAAAAFAADRGDIKSSDVLRIADTWLAWVSVPKAPEDVPLRGRED